MVLFSLTNKKNISNFSPLEQSGNRLDYFCSIVFLLFMAVSLTSCLRLQPKEEEMVEMADEFIERLGIQVSVKEREVKIVPWFGDDVTPSSYIVSTYGIWEPRSSAEAKIRKRLASEDNWVIKEIGDEWFFSEKITELSGFCATRLAADGTYEHSPVLDNSVILTNDDELIITLYYDSPDSCKLIDSEKDKQGSD